MPSSADVSAATVDFTTDHFTAFVVGEASDDAENYSHKWKIGDNLTYSHD